MSQLCTQSFVTWRTLSQNLTSRIWTPLKIYCTRRLKSGKCFAEPFRFRETCTKNINGAVLAKNITGSCCRPIGVISSSIFAPKLRSIPNFFGESRNFCSNSPYDPEKDAFIQDILKEVGRDFSSEKKESDECVSNEIDSGYESDSDTNLEKSTGGSSSSSDSDSDLDDKTSNIQGSGSGSCSLNESEQDVGKWNRRGQILEAEMKEIGLAKGVEHGAVLAEVKEDMLEDYEEIEAYSDEDDEVEEIFERVHVIPLERGETGVFDIDELVAVLRDENAIDLCVMEVPKHFNYVDYMVVASGRSVRHIRAMAEYLKFLHKKKKSQKDRYLKIEGLDAKDWVAVDLGNIALHLFMPATREIYGLESLWALGGQYDNQTMQQEDAYAFLFDQQGAVQGVSTDFNESPTSTFSSDFRPKVSEDGAKDSYDMHSDQWHQVKTTNFENKTDVDR